MFKIAGWVANSVDPDEMPHLWHLIWVYTVCTGLSDQIHTIKYNIWKDHAQTGKIMTKSSAITNQLLITMAGLIIDFSFQLWLASLMPWPTTDVSKQQRYWWDCADMQAYGLTALFPWHNTSTMAQFLVSAFWLGGYGFDPQLSHTKDWKKMQSACTFVWCLALRK